MKRRWAVATATLVGLGVAAVALVRGGTDAIAHDARIGDPPVEFTTARGLEVELFRGERWRLFRHVPSGFLAVHVRSDDSGDFIDVQIPSDWRKHSHPMFAAEDGAGGLLLVIYDTVENTPSGRRLDVVTNRFEVHRLSSDPADRGPKRLVGGLEFGGIDTQIYGSVDRGSLHLCGDDRCYSVDRSGRARSWSLDALGGTEFVEVAFEGARAAAIVRPRHDDRRDGPVGPAAASYRLATFDPRGNVSTTPLDGGLPFAVRFVAGGPTVSTATTREDLRRVLYHDLRRLGLAGRLDYGANNLEGRVAWSQAYYLNGLASLLGETLAWLRPDDEQALRERLRRETALLLTLCADDYPGFRAKRYSVDREPLLFALHLGRTLHLLLRVRDAVPDLSMDACVGRLSRELATFERTVEEPFVTIAETGAERPFLRYRRGMPFWADGTIVPYNFVSGVASGLALLDDDGRRSAARLMRLMSDEVFSGPPPTLWRYWSGDGDRGWAPESGLSLNTPRYAGNRGAMAHVTYRTKDATALTLVGGAGGAPEDGVPAALLDWFRDLTRDGWLLPSMNEVFVREGPPVTLAPAVARRHARSAAAWELQSQVWALHALASDLR
jgi:hypothetical protein